MESYMKNENAWAVEKNILAISQYVKLLMNKSEHVQSWKSEQQAEQFKVYWFNILTVSEWMLIVCANSMKNFTEWYELLSVRWQ